MVFTIPLGQGLGSCNVSVSVSSRTLNVSSRSRLGQNAQRLSLGPMRFGSRLGLGLKGLVPIPVCHNGPWLEWTLAIAALGYNGPWLYRTLATVDLGYSGPWLYRTGTVTTVTAINQHQDHGSETTPLGLTQVFTSFLHAVCCNNKI